MEIKNTDDIKYIFPEEDLPGSPRLGSHWYYYDAHSNPKINITFYNLSLKNE